MTMSGQAGGNKHTDWLIENWEQGQKSHNSQFPINICPDNEAGRCQNIIIS